MLHISTQKLIEKLLERTLSGTIDWKERVPDGVILETEGYVVELTASPANVKLSQVSGRLLEDVTHEVLESTLNQAGRDYASIVVELAGEADRYAKGTEQAIASILDAVESSNTPVLKSGPSFLGQPKTEVPATEAEEANTEAETVSSDSDPSTEAGMNAAIVKMVAEINGPPAGEELDELENSPETEADEEPAEIEQEEPIAEVEAEPVVESEEVELTPENAEALLAEGLPEEPSVDEIENIEEQIEEDIPEFKTHIVETPASGIAAGSMAAAAAAAALAQSTADETSETEDNTDEITSDETHASENDDDLSTDTPETLPELPDIHDIDELETAVEDETDTVEAEAEIEETEASIEEILPPPPLDLEPTEKTLDSDTLEIDLPELEDEIQLDDIEETVIAEPEADFNKPATNDHFQPFAKRSAEIAEDAAEDEVEPATAFEDDMPPAPKALPQVDEELAALDIEQQAIELEVATHTTAPEALEAPPTPEAPEQEPQMVEEAAASAKTEDAPVEPKPTTPAPLGFTFKNKVTATGLTIGRNIGTLISGVPEDIRQRADDHERMVRLQTEKAQAEERAIKARKAAEDARKSSVGFKSWS